MFKEFETQKFYYGFPIFLIGYEDDRYQYNVTTCSSSYTLGDMVVIGLAAQSNAVKQIEKFKHFSINLLSSEHMDLVEKAGFNPAKDKLNLYDIAYEFFKDSRVPLISKATISLIVNVEKIDYQGDYVNITGKINHRLFNHELLEHPTFIREKFEPFLYVGDDKKRVYRFVNKIVIDGGSFFE